MSPSTPLNIVFAGTPDFSASVLDAILSQGYSISAVYCQPDRRMGRGKKIIFGPVKSLAVEHHIPVEQPIKFDQELDKNGLTAANKFATYQPDLMIVVAYGLILPEEILSIPRFGCINIHASILPRWRGAAPIQRAIENGDEQTGVTIMQMDKGLDTGNMLSIHPCKVDQYETGSTLHDRLAEIGSNAILEFLSSISKQSGSSLNPGQAQDNQLATYAHKLSKSEAQINWSEPAITIERKIRAFNSWPVSFTYVGESRLRIWQSMLPDSRTDDISNNEDSHQAGKIIKFDKNGITVACGVGEFILITQLQADGSRVMNAGEFLNSKSQWFIDNPILG